MSQIKEAIKPLEEALDYKADYAYDFMCKKIKQALAILTEQPPAGEPISLERQNEILFEANRNIKAHLDRSEAENKVYLKCVNEREEQCDKMSGEIKELGKALDLCGRLRQDDHKKAVDELVTTRKYLATKADKAEASRKELLTACEEALRIADSWTHDQLDGTSLLKNALKELEPIIAAITKEKEVKK